MSKFLPLLISCQLLFFVEGKLDAGFHATIELMAVNMVNRWNLL